MDGTEGGLMNSSVMIGTLCFTVGLYCVMKLPETFHRDIEF